MRAAEAVRRVRGPRLLFGAAAVAVAVVCLVAMLLPSRALAWMRRNIELFNVPMNWIEAQQAPVDLVHLALFFLLGAAVAGSLQRVGWRALLAGLVAFSVVTEVVQFWIPGRHPRWTDIAVDLVAATLGLLLVRAVAVAWRRRLRQ